MGKWLSDLYDKLDSNTKALLNPLVDLGKEFKNLFIPTSTEELVDMYSPVGDVRLGQDISDMGWEEVADGNILDGYGKVIAGPLLSTVLLAAPNGVNGSLRGLLGLPRKKMSAETLAQVAAKRAERKAAGPADKFGKYVWNGNAWSPSWTYKTGDRKANQAAWEAERREAMQQATLQSRKSGGSINYLNMF